MIFAKRGGPRLLHLALSVVATVTFITFDAATRADVIDVSAVDYAILKKTMRNLEMVPDGIDDTTRLARGGVSSAF